MSLKIFHIFFITISLILCFGFSWWSFQQSGGYVIIGIGSIAAGIALFFYGKNFLNKMENLLP